MGVAAADTKGEFDDVGRAKREGVRPGAVAVCDEDDDRTVGAATGAPRRERLDDRLDGRGGHEREVDRQHQDRLRATGDHVRTGLDEAGVESA